jgi:beta-N-acetylglucosaminidase
MYNSQFYYQQGWTEAIQTIIDKIKSIEKEYYNNKKQKPLTLTTNDILELLKDTL